MNNTFAKSSIFLFFICLISSTQLFSQALNLGSNFILCSSNSPSTISANTSGLGINSVISYAWRINSTIISNSISTLSVSPNLSANPQIVSCIVTLSNSNTISDTVKVYTIYPGTISSGIQIACNSSGYDPSLFGSTNNGTESLIGTPNFSYSYQWQISTDNINWTTIPNTNSATYDSPQITTTSYFRRAIIVSIGNGSNSISTTCYSNVIDVQFLGTNTPTFNFPVTGCPGTSYFPSNFTPQAGTSYVWTVSPSSNSTGLTTNSPSFIFNNGGSYSVSVTATTNNSGCSATSSTASITLPSLSILKPTIKVGIANYNTTTANPNTIAICTGVLTSNASIVNNGPNTNPSGTTYTYSFNSGPATSIEVLNPPASISLTYGNNPLVMTSNFNGCSQSVTVNVYSGSNPYVSLGTSNSVGLCIGDSLAFFIDPIPQSGQANPPGTTYTLTYSDVTNSTVFPVIIDDTTIIHTYNNTSCGATYLGGFYPSNTFFAKVTAQNFCGQTSSFVSPITVNNAPVADFTVTDSTFFAGQTITASITGVSGNVIGSSPPYDCNSEGKFYWVITGGVIGTNYNLTSGTLGSYNSNYINLLGQPDYTDNGSSSIEINFITAGYYTITLHYYNNCGIKTKVSNICVITPPVCQFSVSPSSGCSPLTVNINNTTVAPTCNGTNIPLSYTWTVTSPTGTSASYASNSTQTPPTLVLTNPLTSSQTFTITLTVNPNEPGDTTQNFSIPNNSISICSQTVVVNPIPIFTPFNITSCSSPYQANINLQSSTNIANSSFSWFAISNTNVNGESTTIQSTPIIGNLLVNNSSSYQTVNYTVKPTSNLGCVGQIVNSSTITINYVTPGTIATDQTICSGTIPATITSSLPASGYGTFCYQWQLSTDNVNWTDIGSCLSTNTTYSPGTLSQNTYFRRVVKYLSNGTTCSDYSNAILITINSFTAPTISASQNICTGNDPAILTISSSATGTALIYQWQSSIASSSTGFINIANQTGLSYDPPVLTGNTWYRLIVTSTLNGLTCPANSNTILISVYNLSPGSIGNNQTICTGGDPTAFTSSPGSSVGTILTYQWQSSLDNISWGNILNATSATYDPGGLSTTSYFRRIVIATLNGTAICQDYSNTLSISVVPDPIINTQSPNQSLCIGGNPNPISVNPSLGVGTNYTYQWYSSSLNSNTGGTLISISGTAQLYSPPSFNILNNTYYYCVVSQSGLGCVVTSIPILISYVADPTVTSPSGASYCQGASTVVPLSVTASGGSSTNYSYQWYNGPIPTGIISGATASTYTPPVATTGTTSYYCIVTINPATSTGCSVTSATALITVNSPTFTTQPIASQIVCLDGSFSPLNVFYPIGTVTPTYQWFSNSTNSTSGGSPLSSASLNTYTPLSNLVGTTYYYCVATFTSGGCTAITSTIASAVVVADPTVNNQPIPSQSICVGGTISNELTASAINGTGTTSYQWSNTAGTISGATNQTFLPPSFSTVGSYTYLVTITLSGSGCNAAISQNAVIDVVADPFVTSQPVGSTYCQDGSPVSQLSVAVSGGFGNFNYQWYSNAANNNSGGSLIPSANNSTYTPIVTMVGTIYYYCIISQNGLNCSVNSNTASIIVYPLPIFYTQPIASQTLCEGGTPTTLEVSYIYGTNSASYQWYESNTNSNTGGTPLLDETNSSYTPPTIIIGSLYYYCVITFQQVGCSTLTSETAHVNVVNDPAINTQPLNSQEICQGNTINSPLNFTFSGGTGNATIAWYLNASPPVLINGITDSSYLPIPFNVADTFSYYATLSLDGVGCNNLFTEMAEIIVHPTPYALNLNNTIVLCNHDNLSILLTASITSTFVWHTSNNPYVTGESFLNQTSNIIDDSLSNNSTNPQFLTYTITPTSPEGCVGPDSSLTVQVQPNVLLNIPQNLEICSGSAVNAVLNANVSSNFQWFVSIDNPNVTGESLISNTSNFISDILINNTTTNQVVIYSVLPSSVLGICNGQAQTITIIVKPQLTLLNTDTTTICSNESVNLNLVANTNVTINWYADQSLNVLNETTSVTTSAIINDILTNLTGNVQQVNYNVTGTSTIDGCSTPIIPITVFVNPLPTVNPSTDLNLCNDFATNPILFTGNVAGSFYNWSSTNLNVGLPTLTGANLIPSFVPTNSGLSPISANIEVTPIFINNNVQCEGPIAQFTITVNPVPSVFDVNNIILCEGELSSAIILLGTLGGTAFNWVNSNVSVGLASPGSGNIPIFTAQNPTLLPIQSTVTVTPVYGLAECPGEDISFDITVNPAPTVNPQNASICSDDMVNLNLSADLPCTFQWYATPNQNVLNETYTPIQNSTIINDLLVQTTTIPQTVQYNISAISTQYNCESSPIIFNVIVNPLPAPSFTILNPPFCDLSPISFQNNTTGILDFIWSFGDGIYSNLYTPSNQFPTFGSYDVELNAINPQTGCNDSIINQIIISPTPSAAFSYSDSLGCDVLDVTYTAVSSNPTWDYFWDFGNGVTSQQASSVGYQFEEEGCFDVSLSVTNNQGCTATKLYPDIACIYDSPIASFSTDQDVLSEIDPLVSFYNNSVNAISFEWEFGDSTNSFAENPIHTYPDDAASYLVTLVAYNEISCTDSTSMRIIILKDVGLYIPNSFTPDGDEYNHTFYPVLTEGYKKDSYHMSIFDRWGELVFETYDVSFGWNGSYRKNGMQCKTGTYTWVIEVIELQSAVNRKFNGHLNLIR